MYLLGGISLYSYKGSITKNWDDATLEAGTFTTDGGYEQTGFPTEIGNDNRSCLVMHFKSGYASLFRTVIVLHMPSTGKGGTYLNTNRSGSWSGWQRIDNYGTSSLSELASALGGGAHAVLLPLDADLNDYTYSNNKLGMFFCDGNDSIANKPASTLYNFLVYNIKHGTSSRQIQIFYCFNTTELYVRNYVHTTGWYAWKRIQLLDLT